MPLQTESAHTKAKWLRRTDFQPDVLSTLRNHRHCCDGEEFKRNGSFSNRNRTVQRYQCLRCGKTFSEMQPLDGVRIETDRAAMVVNLLCEGVGIRAISRLTLLNKNTVLNVLETAGRHCEQIMESRVRGLHVNEIEIDEAYAFVGCLQQNVKGPRDTERGEQFAYLAVDVKSKLILHAHIGKRDTFSSRDFLEGLKPKIEGRFQITSDSFLGYCSPFGGVKFVFGASVDYATEEKTYAQLEEGKRRINNPVICTSIRRKARLGNPDMARATTNHVERTNLSVRLFNRRWTRKTMGFSRKLENHRWSVILLAAHFNFCRVHSAHNQTPAMAAGLTDHVWTVGELLAAEC